MNVMQQECRYLLLVASAVMNQKKTPVLSNSLMSWRDLYQVAEANQVANLIYLGILGFGSDIEKQARTLFYKSYQKELKNVPLYRSAEEVLLWQLERHRIYFMILEGQFLRELYPQKELRRMDRIRVWVSKGELHRIDSIMRSMDYELHENREDDGILYYKIPGVYVAFYEKLRFVSKRMEKYFDSPVRMFSKVKGYRYLRSFDEEEAYLYMAGRAASEYALGRAGIRTVLDFWLYEKRHSEELDWSYINRVLKRKRLQEFSRHLLRLGNIWFGNEVCDEMEIYNAMEMYIFSRGEQGRQTSEKILPLLQDVADFYRRDREGEWQIKEKELLFPKREYMETLFPVLKKFPWLFFPCCLIRLWRIKVSRRKQLDEKKSKEDIRME